MVKLVGVDQVIHFSFPVKKRPVKDRDWNIPGWNRSVPVAGKPILPDPSPVQKNEGFSVVQAEKLHCMEHNYYRGSINVINEGSDDARGCP
jgi:hypothetical protein